MNELFDRCIDLLEKYRNHLVYITNNCKCNQNIDYRLITNGLENEYKCILSETQSKMNVVDANSLNYINNDNISITTNGMSYNSENELSKSIKNNKTKYERHGRRTDRIKHAILSGQQHESHRKDKVIPERHQCSQFECKCKVKCSSKFTDQQKRFLFQQFYSFKTHSQQYLYLKGLVTPKVQQKSKKYKMFDYFIEVPDSNNKSVRRKVCQKAFLNLLALKKSELRKKIQMNRANSDDNRGKHHNRANRKRVYDSDPNG